MGLDHYEYQCGRGVKVTDKTAFALRDKAKEHNISLSLHAPYFISLSSIEPEKRDNSINYILQSCDAAQRIGAQRIVIHSGSCAKISREDALELAKDTITRARKAAVEQGFDSIIFCPETMGKVNQLGNLYEVLELCKLDETFLPCVDFGHLNAREFGYIKGKAEYEKILRQEQLTADESYSIRLKLKNLTDKLADAQLQKQNENAKKAQEYALAAYTKLINGQVKKLNDLNDAIKAGADRKVKEIDEQLEKRRQKQEDDSRKKELDAINLQLKYMHDDNETSRLSLEQRRQEILNEQAEADYQRRMEQKKLDIQNKANDKIDKNTAAMKNLNTTLENFSYLLAKASGTLSTQQIINNNNVTQNFEAVRGSALTQKQAQQFLKAIVSL